MDITTTSPLLLHTVATKKTKELAIAGIPFYVYAVSIASLLAVSGTLWDISWHRSIGRDKFYQPSFVDLPRCCFQRFVFRRAGDLE